MKIKFLTTERLAGLFYLGLAITGVFSFLLAKTKLYIAGDAMATTTNLITQGGLARFGIASEIALVAFQALAAMWFFKLFRKVNSFAAITLASFGMVNAVAILISSAFWLSALLLANSVSVTPPAIDHANTVLMLFELHETIWIVSGLFFGLWLIPMGYLVNATKMPKALGWVLIGGGLGYILSTFLTILAPNLPTSFIEGLVIPATIGEFWIIGYLLSKKIKC